MAKASEEATKPWTPREGEIGFPGLFRSFSDEQVEPLDATIKGTIPEWLEGSLLRNGPGKFEVGPDTYEHWFDGLAVLIRYNIHRGKVTYQSRFLRSDSYVKATEQNRIVMSEFGTVAHPDPCQSYLGRFLSRFVPRTFTDNGNINWAQYGDEFYAVTDGTLMRRVDPKSLETYEKVNVADRIAVHSTSSHPHTAKDGTIYGLGSRFSYRSTYNIIKIPPRDPDIKGDPLYGATVLCSIPASGTYPTFYHSFAMTDNYFVFVEQSAVINLLKVLYAQLFFKSYIIGMEFHDERPARFHVVRRDTGELLPQVYTSIPFLSFHHINAYEEAGHLVIDMCIYEDGSILGDINLRDLRNGAKPAQFGKAKRFVLPVGKTIEEYRDGKQPDFLQRFETDVTMKDDGSIHCIPEVIADRNVEFPRMNYELYNGKPYRYFYANGGELNQMLLKVDTKSVTSREWYENGCFPSEPIFVSAPEPKSEDDGVVLSSVVDLRQGQFSFLLVLDARDFTEMARAEVDAQVSFGYHGMFNPESDTAR